MGDRSLAEWLGEADEDDADDRRSRAPDDDFRDRRSSRRPARLWVLALAPWVVIAVGVVVLSGRGADPDDAPASGVDDPSEHGNGSDDLGAPVEPTDAEAPATAERLTPGDGLGSGGTDGVGGADAGVADPGVAGGPAMATHLAAGAAPAEAAAVAAVHLLVTGAGEDGAERYVELATVEGATPVTHDTTVVTVLAVVLEGSEGTWTSRRPARYAVPLRLAGGEAAVLGAPWPLPTAAVHADERPDGEPDEDPASAAAAVAALTTAGYSEVEVTGVARLGPGLLRASVTAVPPGEHAPRALEPWLTDHPAPRLLGIGAHQPSDTDGTAPLPAPSEPGDPDLSPFPDEAPDAGAATDVP